MSGRRTSSTTNCCSSSRSAAGPEYRICYAACGVCAGYGDSFAADETVISSTARNFKGRMGPPSTQVYLASPYTVAASAIAGRIADAREVLA